MMNTQYLATHLRAPLQSSYAAFTAEWEKVLGRLDVPALAKAAHDEPAIEAAIATMQGEQGLTMFAFEDLGKLLSLTGPPRQAKRYFVGNYMRASQIISQNIRLGLYAPIRILVYAEDNQVAYIEYDLPSTQFSQFEDELITRSGFGLDEKLSNLIAAVDQRAAAHSIL